MRKFILSTLTAAVFGAYIFSQHRVPEGTVIKPANLQSVSINTDTQTTSPAPDPSKTTPAPAPATVKKSAGQYTDGSYTGSVEDAYYGLVQVRATISDGKLTAVTFLQYPNDRSTSRMINSQAMPYLQAEAIQAQRARVDIVSGATDTSQAFIQSLGNALSQAKS